MKKNILQKIVENKKEELESKKSNWEKFREMFLKKEANLIAEIKLASPKFDYSEQINLEKVFEFYWKNTEIKAVSNLIDEKYFSWDIIRWKDFKQKYNKPIFFKEFVISKTQIDWANYYWYDALLLLERVLTEKELISFSEYSLEKNIFPIIEVDTEEGLEKVLNLNLNVWIWINCRDLWNMVINIEKHFSIIKKFNKILENKIIFALSWINDLDIIWEYKWIYNWVLVGSYFMKQLSKENI